MSGVVPQEFEPVITSYSIHYTKLYEFSHVRVYQHGDDVRAIDWKVTARRGTPFVRQFVEERDLSVVLVVVV